MLSTRRDIDPVAHQIAVGLVDDVAQVNADANLDAPIVGHAGVALGEPVSHIDDAAYFFNTLRNSRIARSPVRLTTRPL